MFHWDIELKIYLPQEYMAGNLVPSSGDSKKASFKQINSAHKEMKDTIVAEVLKIVKQIITRKDLTLTLRGIPTTAHILDLLIILDQTYLGRG